MRFLVLQALLATVVLAQDAEYGVYSGGLGVDVKDIFGALQTPNATGRVPISGFDISKPWPGVAIDGWSIDINVTADIPASTGNETGFVTGTGIKISPPASLVEFTPGGPELRVDNQTWKICYEYYGWIDDTDDDGSCASALGKECLCDLGTAVKAEYASDGKCGATNPPLSCDDAMERVTGGGAGGGVPLNGRMVNGSVAVTVNDGTEDAIHQLGNHTAYDKVARRAHLLILTWGSPNMSFELGPGVVDYPFAVSITCARANNTVAGSRVPAAASGLSSSMGFVLGLVAVVWCFLL